MNTTQLCEASADPIVSSQLKAQIEDAIAADAIFTTLMGEEVEPRRAFIGGMLWVFGIWMCDSKRFFLNQGWASR